VRAPSTPTVVAAHALLVVATAAALFPVSWVLKMALSPSQGMAVTANPLPTEVDFGNFAAVVGTHAADGTWLFGRQLVNSLVVSGATATVGVTLACSAAYAMSRWSFPGRDRAMQLFLLTQMFPGVVSAIPLYILLDRLGLLDSLTGLILVYSTTTVPFATWNLKGYFDSIPRELEEAAMLDGATRFQTFTRIILPLARPAIVVTGLFAFLTAWNEFILAATLMGDERGYTLPVVLNGYVGEFGAEWGRFSAGAILVSVPVTLLFFALQRYLVEGLTAGSVKG
jgi:arabinogalactan oligomer/maltooligosaccharide transport system permease protein